jgi:hypothetical protein
MGCVCVCLANVCVRAAALCAHSRGTASTCDIYSRPATRAHTYTPTYAFFGSRALAAGAMWRCRTASAPWAGRRDHTSVVDAAGAIYVIGGRGFNNTFFNDVWASTDGGARPASVGGGRAAHVRAAADSITCMACMSLGHETCAR